jgi:hypothetical protein
MKIHQRHIVDEHVVGPLKKGGVYGENGRKAPGAMPAAIERSAPRDPLVKIPVFEGFGKPVKPRAVFIAAVMAQISDSFPRAQRASPKAVEKHRLFARSDRFPGEGRNSWYRRAAPAWGSPYLFCHYVHKTGSL